MLCLCAAQLQFWFQTDRGRENSASYYRQGRQLLLTFITMVTRWSHSMSNFYVLIGQNLRGAENLCSILKLSYVDSWSWESFESTCNVFNCLFLLDVQNEIQLLSKVLCYSWLVCLLGFWLRNTSFVKVGNPISMASFSFFTLLDAYKEGWKVWSGSGLTWEASRGCIWNGKSEKLLYLMFVF